MPPEKSSSTFPEPPDPWDLLDAAVWDLVGEAVLPPMAGGALPAFLGDAWDWAKGQLLDPAGAFFRDVLAEIGRVVAGATTTVLEWILKSAYQLLRFTLWSGIPDGYQPRYPATIAEVTQSPWMYIRRILEMPAVWVYGRLVDVVTWLWDRVSGLIGAFPGVWRTLSDYMGGWFRQLWYGVSGWVSDAAGWVWGLVSGLIGAIPGAWRTLSAYMGGWFEQMWHGVSGWVSDAAGWVWGLVSGLIGAIPGAWRTLSAYMGGWFEQMWHGVSGWVSDAAAWLAGRVETWARWLWSQVEAGFQWAWDNVISKIPEGIVAGAEAIGRTIMDAFMWLVNNAFEPFVDVLAAKFAIPGKLLRGEYDSVEVLIDDLMDPPNELLRAGALIALTPIYMIVGLLLAFFPPYRPILNKLEWDVAAVVGGTLPAFQMLRDGFRRELMSEGDHDGWLRRGGLTTDLISLQKQLYEEIPGPSDLITMGVREVFTPEIAERFGQFEDLPPAFVDWMGKQGYTEEWARNFWGMHWSLPSVTQAFEMFHRDVISGSDMQLLLRAQDVMPFWREKLTEIAYRVISRVDVRRMYAEGVFSRDQVLRVYKDLGYKPEDAEALTEFVVLRYPPKGDETADDLRSLTVSAIKRAYARRLITQDDALEGLQELDYSPDDAALVMSIWEFDWTQDPSLRSDVDPKGLARGVIEDAYERRLIDLNGGVRELGEMGYTPEDARLLLQRVDLRLAEQLANLEIDGLVSDYQDGVITDGQLAAALEDLHVPQARVDFLLQREILSRQAKRRRLTLSQMKKAVAADLMGVGEYRARLDVMGYNARDVDILVALDVEAV